MLTATGIGSGLDIEGLVRSLMAAERAPFEGRLDRRESELTQKLSAFGSLKGALSTFQDSLANLNKLSTFSQRAVTSSNDSIVAVTAGTGAVPGNYEITVSQLAQSHSLVSGSYAAANDVVGTGTLTFRFGTTDYVSSPESYNSFSVNADKPSASVVIDSSNNTLEGIRDAVNKADIGVTASIINDGSGHRLIFKSTETGAENSLEVSVADTGDGNNLDAGGLSALAFNSGATNLAQTMEARDAQFTVNGLAVSNSSNNVSDALEGLSLQLKGLTSGSPVQLSVTEDKAAIREGVEKFVEEYNKFIGVANGLTKYEAATEKAGVLLGDFTARSVLSRVRQALSASVSGGSGAFGTLAEIGVTTTAEGTLKIDSTRLEKVLDGDFSDLAKLFSAVGTATDSGVRFLASNTATQVGDYAVNVTQLASQGRMVGSAIGFPLTIDANNDTLELTVDGVASGAITLAQGVFASGSELAAEMQARINGSLLAAQGVKVEVRFAGDHFEIVSSRYGSASTVEITQVDLNTSAQLGLSVGAGTAGTDVAGTIGGLAATGSGQVLTGAAGGATEGLQILIDGGAIGARGSIGFSRGISDQLNTLIDEFLGTDGLLKSRTESLDSQKRGIVDQREDLDYRMERLEASYRRRFNALDSLMAQLQGTSSFLAQQLASLPQPGQG